ncbi:MAG: hypothetical protein ACI8RD_005214 [Bacillariaceae sp.]|jgi:hypothetical protein
MRTIVTSYSEQQRSLVVQDMDYSPSSPASQPTTATATTSNNNNEGGESSGVSILNKAKEIMMQMQYQHQPQEVTTSFETAETKTTMSSIVPVVSPALSPISHAKSYVEQDQDEPRNKDDDDDDYDDDPGNSNKGKSNIYTNNLIDSDDNTTINGDDSNSQSFSQSISQSLSQFALSLTQSQQQQQPQSQSQQQSPQPQPQLLLKDYVNNNNNNVVVDLNDLFLLLKLQEWDKVFELLEKNPNLVASSQQSKAAGSTSPLLHDVLRYNPPLSVVDLLLLIDNNNINDNDDNDNDNNDVIQKQQQQQSSVMKQTDVFGRLPLHVACSCGPNADIDVIIKLILSDTDALRTRTLDRHGRFPLHIAVIMNSSEDAVMELLTNYPDACFIPDLHGKIPIEYAEESSYRNGHNRLVVALESAPILLASSQAGINRISKEYENRLSCLRDAHTEYANQLEDRYTNEKFELLTNQLKSNDKLATEKERNIALAEELLEKKKSELILIRERDELQSKLDMERSLRRNVSKMRDEEFKRILLGKEKESNNNNDDCDDDDQGKDDDDDDDDEKEEEDSSKMTVSTLLKRLSKGYENSKLRIRSYKKQLGRQRETITNMNHLLTGKEEELRLVNRKFRSSYDDDSERQTAIDRANNLAGLHEIALQNLAEARDEVDRLKRIDTQRRSKIAHSERRLRIQEKRLSGVQNLMSSLSTNVGSWRTTGDKNGDNAVDDREEEEVEENNNTNNNNDNHYLEENNNMFDGAGSTITSPSMRQDEADLSVEIEMAATLAAMTAAHLDGAATNITSPSMRLREMDLSVEIRLAAAAMTNATATYQHVEHDDDEKEDTINEEDHTSSSNGSILTPNTSKQPTIKNRRIKSVKRRQNTYSILTATTATTDRDDGSSGSGDTSGDMTSIPETPPIPERVDGTMNREDDDCSPLGLPTFAFQYT